MTPMRPAAEWMAVYYDDDDVDCEKFPSLTDLIELVQSDARAAAIGECAHAVLVLHDPFESDESYRKYGESIPYSEAILALLPTDTTKAKP